MMAMRRMLKEFCWSKLAIWVFTCPSSAEKTEENENVVDLGFDVTI